MTEPRSLRWALSWPARKFMHELRSRQARRQLTRLRPVEIPLHRNGAELRVLWVLAGNEWIGSARLKGTILDDYFRRNPDGIFSRIAYMPSAQEYVSPELAWSPRVWNRLLDRGVDVVSVQTRTGATAALLKDCRERGVATVFALSDHSFDTVDPEVFTLADAVVVSSEALGAEASRRSPNVRVIDDPIEVPAGCRRQATQNGSRPELVWLGHQYHWPDVLFLRDVLNCEELAGLKLRTITRHPDATHQWTPDTVWSHACGSDIAVIPCELDALGSAKSSNRLACFMALGYPVVATPIPSYRAHIRHGENGFFATSPEEWRDCLRRLRDPALREEIGHKAAASPSLQGLRLPKIAGRWMEVFQSVRARNPRAPR